MKEEKSCDNGFLTRNRHQREQRNRSIRDVERTTKPSFADWFLFNWKRERLSDI